MIKLIAFVTLFAFVCVKCIEPLPVHGPTSENTKMLNYNEMKLFFCEKLLNKVEKRLVGMAHGLSEIEQRRRSYMDGVRSGIKELLERMRPDEKPRLTYRNGTVVKQRHY